MLYATVLTGSKTAQMPPYFRKMSITKYALNSIMKGFLFIMPPPPPQLFLSFYSFMLRASCYNSSSFSVTWPMFEERNEAKQGTAQYCISIITFEWIRVASN